jgi:hypothetical protein
MNEQQLLELKLKINETEKKMESLKEEFEQDYDPDHAEIYEEDIEDQEKILKGLQLEYKNAFEKTKPIIKKRLNDLLIKNNFSEETIVKKKAQIIKTRSIIHRYRPRNYKYLLEFLFCKMYFKTL